MLLQTIVLLVVSSSVLLVGAWTQEDILATHGKFLSEQELQFLKRRLQGDYSSTIDELFANRDQINRTVQVTENGVISTTTSTSDYVVSLIQMHVTAMKNLQFPIRQGDPLFVSLFENIDQTSMEVQNITDGVNVTHTGSTDCGVILVQEHAAQVSSFVDTGVRRPNFDWTEPNVCDNPQSLGPSPTMTTTLDPTGLSTTSPPALSMDTVTTSPPTLSAVTTSPTLSTVTTSPTLSSVTTPPAEDMVEAPTSSSSRAKKTVAIVCLLSVFVSFLY